MQSSDAIELLKDFTALYVISSVDDIIFYVVRRGFFGTELLQKAAMAENIEITDHANSADARRDCTCSNGSCFKTSFLHTILFLSVLFWLVVLVLQEKGVIAKYKYPGCENGMQDFSSKWRLLENENCDMIFNNPDCAYDGGDCLEFNSIYPGCREMNITDASKIGDGNCDGFPYNSFECRFDGGDCSKENATKAKYPLCEKAAPSFGTNWTLVENGVCDMVSERCLSFVLQ